MEDVKELTTPGHSRKLARPRLGCRIALLVAMNTALDSFSASYRTHRHRTFQPIISNRNTAEDPEKTNYSSITQYMNMQTDILHNQSLNSSSQDRN